MSPMIEGQDQVLGDIFDDDYAFRIPPYQRPFAWTEEEGEELFDDVLQQVDGADNETGNVSDYFLGAIVLVRSGQRRYSIIDGQQRITTLTLLYAALREKLEGSARDGAQARIVSQPDDLKDIPAEPRLTVREQDFFRRYIQSDDPSRISELQHMDIGHSSEAVRNIRDITKMFLERLDELPQDRIRKFAEYLTQHCVMVVVTTEKNQSAYRIFSVLNDRGIDLQPSDILKADVLGKISDDDDQHQYAEEWEETEKMLGRDGFQDLLSQLRMIHRRRRLSKSLVEEFRDSVLSQYSSQVFVEDVLIPYADTYDRVVNCDFETEELSDQLNTMLRWLKRVNHSDWIAPVIAYYRQCDPSPSEFLEFLTAMERLAAILMIRRKKRSTRASRYGSLLKEIAEKQAAGPDFPSFALGDYWKTKALSRLDGDVCNDMTYMCMRYVLLRLDSLLADDIARYDYSRISVEHVLPQNPEMDGEWRELFSEPERENLTHCLGNLVLLARRKNSQASNWCFERKKSEYFATEEGQACPFVLTTQVIQEDEWTPEVIERRQEALVEKLAEEWRLK